MEDAIREVPKSERWMQVLELEEVRNVLIENRDGKLSREWLQLFRDCPDELIHHNHSSLFVGILSPSTFLFELQSPFFGLYNGLWHVFDSHPNANLSPQNPAT